MQRSTQVQSSAFSSYAPDSSKSETEDKEWPVTLPPLQLCLAGARPALAVLSFSLQLHKAMDCRHRYLKDKTTIPLPHFN